VSSNAQTNNFIRFLKGCLAWDPNERFSPKEALMHEWILEGLPPKVLVQHKKMLGIEEFPATKPESDRNKTQNLIENLLCLSGEGNKSNRSHRRKVSNHLSREYSQEMKEK
jgi:serine/threonine protein kinase